MDFFFPKPTHSKPPIPLNETKISDVVFGKNAIMLICEPDTVELFKYLQSKITHSGEWHLVLHKGKGRSAIFTTWMEPGSDQAKSMTETLHRTTIDSPKIENDNSIDIVFYSCEAYIKISLGNNWFSLRNKFIIKFNKESITLE